MKKMKFVALMAGILVAGMGTAMAANSSTSIAYVNVPYLFQNSPLRPQLIKDINSIVAPKITSLKSEVAVINSDVKALSAGIANKTLTKSQIQLQENTITQLKQAYAKNAQQVQVEVNQLQATARNRIMQNIDQEAAKVAQFNGYSYVLPQQTVLYGPTSANITKQVLAAMNAQYSAQQTSSSNANS